MARVFSLLPSLSEKKNCRSYLETTHEENEHLICASLNTRDLALFTLKLDQLNKTQTCLSYHWTI